MYQELHNTLTTMALCGVHDTSHCHHVLWTGYSKNLAILKTLIICWFPFVLQCTLYLLDTCHIHHKAQVTERHLVDEGSQTSAVLFVISFRVFGFLHCSMVCIAKNIANCRKNPQFLPIKGAQMPTSKLWFLPLFNVASLEFILSLSGPGQALPSTPFQYPLPSEPKFKPLRAGFLFVVSFLSALARFAHKIGDILLGTLAVQWHVAPF